MCLFIPHLLKIYLWKLELMPYFYLCRFSCSRERHQNSTSLIFFFYFKKAIVASKCLKGVPGDVRANILYTWFSCPFVSLHCKSKAALRGIGRNSQNRKVSSLAGKRGERQAVTFLCIGGRQWAMDGEGNRGLNDLTVCVLLCVNMYNSLKT